MCAGPGEEESSTTHACTQPVSGWRQSRLVAAMQHAAPLSLCEVYASHSPSSVPGTCRLHAQLSGTRVYMLLPRSKSPPPLTPITSFQSAVAFAQTNKSATSCVLSVYGLFPKYHALCCFSRIEYTHHATSCVRKFCGIDHSGVQGPRIENSLWNRFSARP